MGSSGVMGSRASFCLRPYPDPKMLKKLTVLAMLLSLARSDGLLPQHPMVSVAIMTRDFL